MLCPMQGRCGFSPRRSINKADTQMRWERGERWVCGCWRPKEPWQGNTLAVRRFAAPTLTVTGRIAHMWCTHIRFLSEEKSEKAVWTARRTHTCTWYHDNPSQSRLLSWRYESLPRTCENRHQTRTNKPHRKFFPRRRNWEKQGGEKKKNGAKRRKAREV